MTVAYKIDTRTVASLQRLCLVVEWVEWAGIGLVVVWYWYGNGMRYVPVSNDVSRVSRQTRHFINEMCLWS